jgi:hypothetical protein
MQPSSGHCSKTIETNKINLLGIPTTIGTAINLPLSH